MTTVIGDNSLLADDISADKFRELVFDLAQKSDSGKEDSISKAESSIVKFAEDNDISEKTLQTGLLLFRSYVDNVSEVGEVSDDTVALDLKELEDLEIAPKLEYSDLPDSEDFKKHPDEFFEAMINHADETIRYSKRYEKDPKTNSSLGAKETVYVVGLVGLGFVVGRLFGGK